MNMDVPTIAQKLQSVKASILITVDRIEHAKLQATYHKADWTMEIRISSLMD